MIAALVATGIAALLCLPILLVACGRLDLEALGLAVLEWWEGA